MIASILLAWSITQGQASQGMFKVLFPAPTGTNGLEDYVLATDLMDDGFWPAYKNWAPPESRAESIRQQQVYQRAFDPSAPPPDPKFVELQQRLKDMNLLQLREEAVAAFTKPLHLITTGNDKPCLVRVDNGSKFPSVGMITDLSLLELDSAYVDASRSRTDAMIADLTNVLLLADRTCRNTYIGSMIATIEQQRVCDACAENLDRLSVQDAIAIETMVTDFLQATPVFIDAYRAAFQSEQEDVARSLRALKAGSQNATKDKQLAGFNQVMSGMSDPEVDQMIQRAQQSIGDAGRIFLSRFSGPEETWLPQDAPGDSLFSDVTPRSPDDVESYFVQHWSLPEVTKPRRLAQALRARTLMRLLRLHATIIAYRWQHEVLPKSLIDLQLPSGYDFDPLSKRQFVYKLSGDGYELYSVGSPFTGKIELGVAGPSTSQPAEINP